MRTILAAALLSSLLLLLAKRPPEPDSTVNRLAGSAGSWGTPEEAGVAEEPWMEPRGGRE